MTMNDAAVLLSEQSYPATSQQLAETHGDYELDLPNGTEQLSTVLARVDDQTFVDANDALLAVYGAVSNKAVGRVGYSDRDPGPIGTHGPDQVSF
jgi:hypothetical protein